MLASLLALPYAHEDLAIVLGACAIVNHVLPVGLVVIAIYLGMVSSDFALYGLGAAARHAPWLGRYAADGRVRGAAARPPGNVFWLVALCRLVPGMVFFAFVACGWMRISLRRFTAASLTISAIYLPLVLLLAIKLGGRLDVAIGPSGWPVLFGGFIGAGLVRKRLFARAPADGADGALAAEPAERPDRAPARLGRVAAAERIPPLLFYAPLALSWCALAARHRSLTLPACANPTIQTGGMWGEFEKQLFPPDRARPASLDRRLDRARPRAGAGERRGRPRTGAAARRSGGNRLPAGRQAGCRLARLWRAADRRCSRAPDLYRGVPAGRDHDPAAPRPVRGRGGGALCPPAGLGFGADRVRSPFASSLRSWATAGPPSPN